MMTQPDPNSGPSFLDGLAIVPLLDALPTPVFMKDLDLRLQWANQSACLLLGMSRQAVVGCRDEDFMPATVAQNCRRQELAVLATGEASDLADQVVQDGDGDAHYVSFHVSALHDARGTMVGLLRLVIDVTALKLAEAERLTSAHRQRDALVQEVHHRIKNHLQGVTGLIERSIAAHPLAAEPLRKTLRQIESIAAAYGLQGNLGGSVLPPEQVVALIAQSHSDGVRVRCAGAIPALSPEWAVPFALVVNELISNGIKHRRAGTEDCVLVDLEPGPEGGLLLRVTSGPSALSAGFDFAAGRGLGTGLRLVRTLLPREGARLGFAQVDGRVVAELALEPPLLEGR